MAAADKTKLDGIAAGAEVNLPAFAKITGNSGTATATAKSDTVAITGDSSIRTTASGKQLALSVVTTDSLSAGIGVASGKAIKDTYDALQAFIATKGKANGLAPLTAALKVASQYLPTTTDLNATAANLLATMSLLSQVLAIANAALPKASTSVPPTANGVPIANGSGSLIAWLPALLAGQAGGVETIVESGTGVYRVGSGLMLQWGSLAPSSNRRVVYHRAFVGTPVVWCYYNNGVGGSSTTSYNVYPDTSYAEIQIMLHSAAGNALYTGLGSTTTWTAIGRWK